MKILTALLIVPFFMGGCQSPVEQLQALGNDHAAITLTVVTPWGTQKLTRVNPTTNQSATVSTDGSIRIDSTSGPVVKP